MKKHLILTIKNNSITLIGLLLILTVAVILFLLTKGQNPATSELSFTEKSILGDNAGSVLPASCESAPTYDHTTGGACPPPTVNLYFQ